MEKRSFVTIVLLTALGTGVTIGPMSALAHAAPSTNATVAAFDQAAWNKTKTRRLADYDGRPEVRVAAWNALTSNTPDAAIAAFWAPGGGFEQAKAQSAKTVERNAAVIRQVLASTTPQTSPAVHAAATRASHGTIAEQDEFVSTGWDAAAAEDEKADQHRTVEVGRQAKADRDHVTSIAAGDPGPWVRAAAQRATRNGSSDADLAEFFTYEWASAGRGDQEAFRVRVADQDLTWQATLNRLLSSAQEAETAMAHAEAAVVDKARTDAVSAWQAVAGHAATATQGWEAERTRAAAQTQSWSAVVDFAKAATTTQDWKSISGNAATNQNIWAEEQAWAQTQAQQWKRVVDSARANQTRLATTS